MNTTTDNNNAKVYILEKATPEWARNMDRARKDWNRKWGKPTQTEIARAIDQSLPKSAATGVEEVAA